MYKNKRNGPGNKHLFNYMPYFDLLRAMLLTGNKIY
jgi:hypothetical protein